MSFKTVLCGDQKSDLVMLPTCYHYATKFGNEPKFTEMLSAFAFLK